MVCVCLGRGARLLVQQIKWCVFVWEEQGCWCSRLSGVCLSGKSRLLVQQIKWCVFVWEEQAVGAAG